MSGPVGQCPRAVATVTPRRTTVRTVAAGTWFGTCGSEDTDSAFFSVLADARINFVPTTECRTLPVASRALPGPWWPRQRSPPRSEHRNFTGTYEAVAVGKAVLAKRDLPTVSCPSSDESRCHGPPFARGRVGEATSLASLRRTFLWADVCAAAARSVRHRTNDRWVNGRR